MNEIKLYDKIVSDKVYRKCVDRGYTTYTEIAKILDVSDSFVKLIFSAHLKKLNLYHLAKLSYELDCSVNDFLPNPKDYAVYFKNSDEYECFISAIEKNYKEANK